MKISGLMIGLVLLAGLGATLYWSDHRSSSGATAPSPDAPPKILVLNEADIVKVDLTKKGGAQVEVSKFDSGWQLTQPKLSADQQAIGTLVSSLATLTSDRLVEEKSADLAQYGLAQPALQVAIREKNGHTQTLLIGDDTPTGNAAFAALQGDPRVFTIASYTKANLDKSPNDLRDKRLLTVQPDKVSRLELLANGQDIEFGRNPNSWQILKPHPLRAASSQVDDLVSKLTDAKMDFRGGSGDHNLTGVFAAAKPVATARLTDAASTQELQVRKNKDDYYAKSSAVPGVYKIASDVAQALDKRLDDFRDKKLFDFGYTDPNAIQFQADGTNYSLTRSGEDWLLNGKKADAANVGTFIDSLRNLSAAKLLDSGSLHREMEVSVTSKQAKRVERVQIGKQGPNYFAQRENEPTLYQLDTKVVDDLRAAAGKLGQAPAQNQQH
jgi:hypothetical protein